MTDALETLRSQEVFALAQRVAARWDDIDRWDALGAKTAITPIPDDPALDQIRRWAVLALQQINPEGLWGTSLCLTRSHLLDALGWVEIADAIAEGRWNRRRKPRPPWHRSKLTMTQRREALAAFLRELADRAERGEVY